MTISAPSFADVSSTSIWDRATVRVIPVGKDKVRFEMCETEYTCKRLGGRDFTKKELHSLVGKEKLKGTGKVVGDTALVGLASILGFFAAGTIVDGSIQLITGEMGNGFGYTLLGATSGGVASAEESLRNAPSSFNPMENFRNASTVRGEITEGRDVKTANVHEYAKRLENILNSIASEKAEARSTM